MAGPSSHNPRKRRRNSPPRSVQSTSSGSELGRQKKCRRKNNDIWESFSTPQIVQAQTVVPEAPTPAPAQGTKSTEPSTNQVLHRTERSHGRKTPGPCPPLPLHPPSGPISKMPQLQGQPWTLASPGSMPHGIPVPMNAASNYPPLTFPIIQAAAQAPRMPLPPQVAIPTVYLISYSTNLFLDARTVVRGQARHYYNEVMRIVPAYAHYLYKIDCAYWMPPPERVARDRTGIDPVCRQHVMRDMRAKLAVHHAVEDIVMALNQGYPAVMMEMTCAWGLHRSVAAAEVMGSALAMRGAKVVIGHANLGYVRRSLHGC